MKETNLAPGLLLSMPHLDDPNFARAVVLMIEHNDEGSFGLIINQASDMKVSELFSALELEWKGAPELRVWTGGPVMPSSGWVIHEVDDDTELEDDLQTGLAEGRAVRAGPGLALTTSTDKLAGLAADPPKRARFLLGYAGWGPDQLADEMSRGSWLHADISLELVFDTPADELWAAALRSLGVNPETIVASRGVH